MKIRFLGHSCFELSDGDTRLLIDPFLTGNPKAAVEASEPNPTHTLLTHGHADHLGDTVDIDRHDAEAVKLVGVPTVIPCHYDTFPPIETDAEAFKSDVEGATSSEVTILQPGDETEL